MKSQIHLHTRQMGPKVVDIDQTLDTKMQLGWLLDYRQETEDVESETKSSTEGGGKDI